MRVSHSFPRILLPETAASNKSNGALPRATTRERRPRPAGGNEGGDEASGRGRDEMAHGSGEPSTKRTKVDEAKEEEDPLVRRREELALGFSNTWAKGKELGARLVREAEEEAEQLYSINVGFHRLLEAQGVRDPMEQQWLKMRLRQKNIVREAKERAILESDRTLSEARLSFGQELRSVCAELEAKNEERLSHFRRLPSELLQKIVDDNLHQNDLFAFAMTCRFFREKQKDLGKKMETDLKYDSLLELRKSGKVASRTLGWFQWVCDTFEIQPGFEGFYDESRVEGAVYEGQLVNYAALQGSVEVLRWLHEEKGFELNDRTGWWAGMGGSIEVFEHLSLRGYKFTKAACEGTAIGGHLEALKYLRGLDPPCLWDNFTCAMAAYGGHLEVLKWLRDQDPPCPWNSLTFSWAAQGGHLEVLKWLRSQDPPCPWDWETCMKAAYKGHLDVLKWLRSQDPPCPWNERTCSWAAEGGHLEVLKWLRSQDPPCPWSEETCSEAARKGHLDVLQWLLSQDPPCPWNDMTCSWAARGGHLDVLKWSRSQDPPCPWNERTCSWAAEGGHLEVLKWLRSQDPPCPWSEETCASAARKGHLKVLKWVLLQNPHWIDQVGELS